MAADSIEPSHCRLVDTSSPPTSTGFQAVKVEGIDVALNRTATVDLRMDGGIADRDDRGPAVRNADRPDSIVDSHVGDRAADCVTPAHTTATISTSSCSRPERSSTPTARAPFGDRDTRGAILGERAGNAAFLIDGFENNDDFHGGVFQAYTQDAIQEFEVIAAGYKAEFGRGSGGVVNAITRSGTNRVKGSGILLPAQ